MPLQAVLSYAFIDFLSIALKLSIVNFSCLIKAETDGEYAKLISEKKAACAEYHRVRNEMKELLTVKANVDLILGVKPEEVKWETSQER